MVSIFLAEIQWARSHFPTSRVFTYQRVPPREIPSPVCCQHHRSSIEESGLAPTLHVGEAKAESSVTQSLNKNGVLPRQCYMSEARQRDFRGCLDVFWFTNILVMENCHPDNQGVECMLINVSPLLNNRPHHDQWVQGNTCSIYILHIQRELKNASKGKGVGRKRVGRKGVGRKHSIPQYLLGSVRAQYKAPLFVPFLLKCPFWWDSPRHLRVKQNFVILERLSLKTLSSWEYPSLCSKAPCSNYYRLYYVVLYCTILYYSILF